MHPDRFPELALEKQLPGRGAGYPAVAWQPGNPRLAAGRRCQGTGGLGRRSIRGACLGAMRELDPGGWRAARPLQSSVGLYLEPGLASHQEN